MSKKNQLPKALSLNPQDHAIELSASLSDDAKLSEVCMKFGSDVNGIYVFTSIEAARVADWFSRLAKAIK